MRSEKLNIKHNIISRLEVPLSAFCAAPVPQPVRGWIVNCDGLPVRFSLRVNGADTPYERIVRPDLQRGYNAVDPQHIFGFDALTSLAEGVTEAVVEIVAEFPDNRTEVLLEARFTVSAVDPLIPEMFADISFVMKPEEFPVPTVADFSGTITLRPFASAEPTAATRVLHRFGHVLADTGNKHALYLSIYDYAADNMDNVAVFQLDLPRLQGAYATAIGRWLQALGTCEVVGPPAVYVALLLARMFPAARIELDEEGHENPVLRERWAVVRRHLGDRPVPRSNAAPASGVPDPATLRAEWPVFAHERPIFVVGAGRSGTSAATRILSQGEYPGFREGHVFSYLEEQLQILAEHWAPIEEEAATAGWAIPERSLFERPLVEMVATAAKRDPAATRWVDKTPDARMLEVIPHLRRIYPNAQYLFLRRHPLKLAESRRRKFHEPLETALAQWTKCERLWAEHKPGLPAGSWIECDQGDFSLRTGPTVRALIEFLQPTAAQQTNMYRAARMDRPENTLRLTSEDGINDRRDFLYRQLLDMLPASLSALNWPPEVVAFYESECAALAEQLGYPAEPTVDRIKRDIRDVSAEIFEAENWLIERACQEASKPKNGVIAAGRDFVQAVLIRFGAVETK